MKQVEGRSPFSDRQISEMRKLFIEIVDERVKALVKPLTLRF